jgi:hypothetical protein
VHFTQSEALGLVMAVLSGQPAAADTDDLVGTALGKVVKALPESVGQQAATLREYASAAPDPRTRPAPIRPSPANSSTPSWPGAECWSRTAARPATSGRRRVVFDPPDRGGPWIRPPMGRLEPLGDGCVLVGSTRNPDMYA